MICALQQPGLANLALAGPGPLALVTVGSAAASFSLSPTCNMLHVSYVCLVDLLLGAALGCSFWTCNVDFKAFPV